MKLNKYSICLITLFVLLVSGWTEILRGNIGNIVEINGQDSQLIDLQIEDIYAVSYNSNNPLINGLELEFKIPSAFFKYRNSFAVYLYKNINPLPDYKVKRYSVSEIQNVLLPQSSYLYFQIPLSNKDQITQKPDTITLKGNLTKKDFPIFVLVAPVMKGIPSSIYKEKISLKIVPQLENKGLVKLSLDTSENLPFELKINGNSYNYSKNGIIIEPGIHNLNLISKHYKDIAMQFTITKGETKDIKINLEKLSPKFMFEAPNIVSIFLDGNQIEPPFNSPIEVSEGEHSVIMKLGDYSVTKRITASGGNMYKISLNIDISVDEN